MIDQTEYHRYTTTIRSTMSSAKIKFKVKRSSETLHQLDTKHIDTIKRELDRDGYSIIPNILSTDDIQYCKELFKSWQHTIPNHDITHKTIDPHGIYRYHQSGHTRHAWYIRTRPTVQNIFKQLWNTDELIVSFDGCCYIPKEWTTKDTCWTHTDQAANSTGLKCYQGLVSLTDNRERTFVVYKGSHTYHEEYFKQQNISNSKKWQLIDKDTLNTIESSKTILHVPAGALVIWDSRTFHQNQYGKPNIEERMVQYVCYLPKSHIKNTDNMRKKRLNYFHTRRTTSHYPVPINVNGLQPQTYGDKSRKIDYRELEESILDDLEMDIFKLL